MRIKKSILLIDDDASIRGALGQALADENFDVVSASNGRDAARELQNKDVDVVLLDVNLGSENGWDTFDNLTQLRPRLPFILITARPDETQFASRGRAHGLMEKPLDLPRLFETLNLLTAHASEEIPNRTRNVSNFTIE